MLAVWEATQKEVIRSVEALKTTYSEEECERYKALLQKRDAIFTLAETPPHQDQTGE